MKEATADATVYISGIESWPLHVIPPSRIKGQKGLSGEKGRGKDGLTKKLTFLSFLLPLVLLLNPRVNLFRILVSISPPQAYPLCGQIVFITRSKPIDQESVSITQLVQIED